MKFLILVVFTSNVRVWGFQLSNVFTGPGGPPPRPAGTGWGGRGSGRSRTRPRGWGSWRAENIQSDQKIFARYAPGAVQLDALQVLAVRVVGVALVPAQVSLRHAADLGRKYEVSLPFNETSTLVDETEPTVNINQQVCLTVRGSSVVFALCLLIEKKIDVNINQNVAQMHGV